MDRQRKLEADAAVAQKRAADQLLKQQEAAAKQAMMQGNVQPVPGILPQDSMVSNGDLDGDLGRTSGRSKTKKDYSTLHRGNSITASGGKPNTIPG